MAGVLTKFVGGIIIIACLLLGVSTMMNTDAVQNSSTDLMAQASLHDQAVEDRAMLTAADYGMGKLNVALKEAGIDVELTDHADKHPEAPWIRATLCSQGPNRIWKTPDNTFYLVCKITEGPKAGKWGLQSIIKGGKQWFERTAFCKGDGCLNALEKYLQSLKATPFKGTLQ